MHKWLQIAVRALGLAAVLSVLGYPGASAQQVVRPAFVNGEVLITVPGGTARATVDQIAAVYNLQVRQAFPNIDGQGARDVYHLRMNAANPTAEQTTALLAQLRADGRVLFAHHNSLKYKLQSGTAVPNDPRFGEQWGHIQMRMPQAWAIEKGQAHVTIAVVDNGTDVDHPEFQGRTLPGFNSVSGTNDPRPVPNTETHGTHVAGIAMAQADNGIGVAGVAWDNTRLLAINADNGVGGFSSAALIAAYDFVLAHKTNNPTRQVVMNLSLGAADASDTPNLADPENAKLLALANAGIVIVCGAGNDGAGGNPPFNPANMASAHRNILCVTATGQTGLRAVYSQFRPYSTVAAPGGDSTVGTTILSTFPVAAGSYGFQEGTSMASPQVAGVVALLLSIPGVSPGDVKDVLTSTARPVSGFRVPSPEYGYGIVDAAAALEKVAVSVTVMEPDGTGGKAGGGGGRLPDPVETLMPTLRVAVRQVPPADFVFKLDGTVITDYVIENITASVRDQQGNDVPLNYDAVVRTRLLSPGPHTIEVSGTKAGKTVTDIRFFTITPRQIPAGRSMIAIPYFENGATPEGYFGTDFRLARWVYETVGIANGRSTATGRYAFYASTGAKEDGASFDKTGVAVRQDGDPATSGFLRGPVGLAFFADTESVKPVVTRGQPLTSRPFIIPLQAAPGGQSIGWNMVGCPFPFDVPFNACLVDTPEGRLSVKIAVDKGYLLPNIYSFDSQNGYTFRTLPDGALRAWTGHWLAVGPGKPDIALVVPPSRTRAAETRAGTPSVEKGGWFLRLEASAKGISDTQNFIGMSSRASDAFDLRDVAKPPTMAPYVSVGVVNDSWGALSGLYAQDIRGGTGTKSWTVVASTDLPNTDVTLRWNGMAGVPKSVRLTIKDETTGQTLDMRSRGSITFKSSDEATSRRFTITAKSAVGDVLRITNVSIRSGGTGRSEGTALVGFTLSGDAVTYEVQVLNAAGAPIATLASRSASAGDVRLVWTGADGGGRKVPAGTYLIQIRAVSSEGDVARVVRPFTFTR